MPSEKARLELARKIVPTLTVIELLFWSGQCGSIHVFTQFGYDYEAAWEFAQTHSVASTWLKDHVGISKISKAKKARIASLLEGMSAFAPVLNLSDLMVQAKLASYAAGNNPSLGHDLEQIVSALEDVIIDPEESKTYKAKTLERLRAAAVTRLAQDEAALARLSKVPGGLPLDRALKVPFGLKEASKEVKAKAKALKVKAKGKGAKSA